MVPAQAGTTIAGTEVRAHEPSSIAWIDSAYKVHVQRLSKPGRWVVGWAAPSGIRSREVPTLSLALAGTRALWRPTVAVAPSKSPFSPAPLATGPGGTPGDDDDRAPSPRVGGRRPRRSRR